LAAQNITEFPRGFGEALEALKTRKNYGKGESLYRRGQAGRGIYLVESGSVRLEAISEVEQGPFGTAGPGAILGLCETVSGHPYFLSAEAVGPVQVAFVQRAQLLRFLREQHEQCMQVVRLLSEDLHLLYESFRARRQDFAEAKRRVSRKVN
jgi:CRP-like cAMP-binding protein